MLLMFPCGHVHYSMLANSDATREQLVGAVLPDAAVTTAFGWADFHQIENVNSFAIAAESDASIAAIIEGIRHHIELDDRSHHRWRHGGGYAYENQTGELREAVARACHVEGDLVRTLAHNFIETAVDLRVLAARPELLDCVHSILEEYVSDGVAEHIARWTGGSAEKMSDCITDYFNLVCKYDVTTVSGMVDLWSELLDVLQATTFDVAEPQSLDKTHARRAIDLALTLTEPDALAVVTP